VSDKCDELRSRLGKLEEELANIPIHDDPGPDDGPRPKPRPSDDFKEKKAQVDQARFALQECEKSLEPPPVPPPPPTAVPLTLTLTKFVCLHQNDHFGVLGIETENDEPYAVVFAVDLKIADLSVASVPVGAINSKMTLVGPLSNVSTGDEVSPPSNVIWGLSNAPDFVSSADNLIVLVAMMENDDGSPDQVRTLLEKAAQLSLLTNVPAFTSLQISRQELVNRIIADMAGAMGAAKVGVPNPDDNIGAIQEFRFFQSRLDDVYRNQGPIEESLTFEGDDAKYVLKFRMFA